MKKSKNNFVKEIFIFILLLILILLILAVGLYDFIPSNINVPEVTEYSSDTVTTSIKQEIAYTNGGDLTSDESINNTQELVTSLKSYSIDAADLNVYDEKNLYNKGNSNPFSYVAEEPQDSTNTTNTVTGGNGQTTNNSTTTGSSTSGTTGTFFENKLSK